MKTLIIAAVFTVLAVCIHEFIVVIMGLSHPWLSWPVGLIVFGVSFVAIGEYETRAR